MQIFPVSVFRTDGNFFFRAGINGFFPPYDNRRRSPHIRPRLKNQRTSLFRLKLRRPASKILGIRKGFLRFFPCSAQFYLENPSFLFLKQGLVDIETAIVYYNKLCEIPADCRKRKKRIPRRGVPQNWETGCGSLRRCADTALLFEIFGCAAGKMVG
jgi:hypothetical protein